MASAARRVRIRFRRYKERPGIMIECNTRNGQAMAAADALTVAERDIQRIKQRGCGTTLTDRAIMQLPDLTALAYPQPTNVPVELDTGANNKYLGRSSVNAEGFVPPFVNTTLLPKEAPRPASLINGDVGSGNSATPGLDFAGTGDLTSLNDVTFGNPSVLYKRIASSIQGEEVASTAVPSILEDPLTPLGRAGVVSPDYARMGKQLEQRLYGARAPEREAAEASFSSRCLSSAQAALYDLLHIEAIRDRRTDMGLPNGNASLAWDVMTRDGRGPHLLFLLILGGLVGLLLWSLFAPPSAAPVLRPAPLPYWHASAAGVAPAYLRAG